MNINLEKDLLMATSSEEASQILHIPEESKSLSQSDLTTLSSRKRESKANLKAVVVE